VDRAVKLNDDFVLETMEICNVKLLLAVIIKEYRKLPIDLFIFECPVANDGPVFLLGRSFSRPQFSA